MYRHVIVALPDGKEVYVNFISSSAGRYLSRQPYVINLLKEVLAPMNLKTASISIERDMGRIIGNTDIIETSDKDTIFYAQALKESVFSRFARNRFPTPSQTLTIVLERDAEAHYELTDTWIGPCTPPFPGDENETKQSKIYWLTHALVQNAQAVQSRSITKDCPY